MKTISNPIITALIFATFLIASSYFLKRTTIGNWVDAAIYIAWTYWFFYYFKNFKKG